MPGSSVPPSNLPPRGGRLSGDQGTGRPRGQAAGASLRGVRGRIGSGAAAHRDAAHARPAYRRGRLPGDPAAARGALVPGGEPQGVLPPGHAQHRPRPGPRPGPAAARTGTARRDRAGRPAVRGPARRRGTVAVAARGAEQPGGAAARRRRAALLRRPQRRRSGPAARHHDRHRQEHRLARHRAPAGPRAPTTATRRATTARRPGQALPTRTSRRPPPSSPRCRSTRRRCARR
jgi:hypothetical protein